MDISEKIFELAGKYESYTSTNLSKLIQHKSLSSGEKEVASLMKKMMEDAGFDEAWIDGLGNVIGRIGSGKKIIAIDGHIDTVDIGNIDQWNFDPLGGDRKSVV